MMKSMTGFGRHTIDEGDLSVTVETRSLNHRFLEIYVRVPSPYSFVEPRMREEVTGCVTRGKVTVSISILDRRQKEKIVRIDDKLMEAYLKASGRIVKEFPVADNLSVEGLLGIKDMVSVEEVEDGEQAVTEKMVECLKVSLGHLLDMRLQEGAMIFTGLNKGIENLKQLNDNIRELSRENKEEMGEKLRERVEECVRLCESSMDGLNDRIMTEVAILSDRLDVSEEVDRIDSHIFQFKNVMEMDKSGKGRTLDFVIQELNREFNTISSKSQSAKISSLVIEAKAELEKMREQTQNVE